MQHSDNVTTILQRLAEAAGEFADLPYDPRRNRLYTCAELQQPSIGTAGELTVDAAIYEHFVDAGRHRPAVGEALAQRLHDHQIEQATARLLDDMGTPPIVGIMGGHSTLRDAPVYRTVADLAFRLARADLLVCSGGGPGSMEAANLGAWLSATADPATIDDALSVLTTVPSWRDPGHDTTAQTIADRYPDGAPSLAIPTWFYGHEPSNRFSPHIAKFFGNAIREDLLVSIATAGIIFTPGSAGTAQEVFQDAAQNHYETLGPAAPMVFLGVDHWKANGIVDVLLRQAGDKPYRDLILLTDDLDEAVGFVSPSGPALH